VRDALQVARGAAGVGRSRLSAAPCEEETRRSTRSRAARCRCPRPGLRTTTSVQAATAPNAARGDAARCRPASPRRVNGVADATSSVTSNATGLSRSENTTPLCRGRARNPSAQSDHRRPRPETEAERQERREADRQRSAAAVEALKSSEGWRAWLRTRSRFHHYTPLISGPFPSTAAVR
jgi:hypothetical protein